MDFDQILCEYHLGIASYCAITEIIILRVPPPPLKFGWGYPVKYTLVHKLENGLMNFAQILSEYHLGTAPYCAIWKVSYSADPPQNRVGVPC